MEEKVKIECTECNGTGKVCYSCCGDDIKGNDYDNCPTCLEHCSLEEEDCDSCNGTGYEEAELLEDIIVQRNGYDILIDLGKELVQQNLLLNICTDLREINQGVLHLKYYTMYEESQKRYAELEQEYNNTLK